MPLARMIEEHRNALTSYEGFRDTLMQGQSSIHAGSKDVTSKVIERYAVLIQEVRSLIRLLEAVREEGGAITPGPRL